MEIIYESIFVSHEHSFITRRLKLQHEIIKIHSHKNFELNYITSGSGKRIVGNSIKPYTQGDLVLMGPNIPHCWDPMLNEAGKEPECIVTHFYENLISSDFLKIPELDEVETLLKSAGNGIVFRGKRVEKAGVSLAKMLNMKGLSLYVELLKVFELLLKIKDREVLALPDSKPIFTDRNQAQINKIYEYVFNNIQSGIFLKDAASLVFMESGSFCRYFRKKTNQTFMNYVKNVRIGIASRLLAETDKQIAQICYECGYKNLANFNLYFKGIMKKTPSEYRRDFR